MSRKSVPFATSVRKYIAEFPDLKYDGCAVLCLVCNKRLIIWKKDNCKKHVNSAIHKLNKRNEIPYATFLYDFLFMLTACNLPLRLISKRPFQVFWNKYVPNYKLPARRTLQKHLPRLRERLENMAIRELHNKNVWITVDETTDLKKNSIINVIVRILSANTFSQPYLLACKRIQACTAANIRQIIMNPLKKFQIHSTQVCMLVTDGAATMLLLGRLLKVTFPKLIHITCVLHALHLVAENVRSSYENVDHLIGSTKQVFLKSPKRLKEFHKTCPDISEPPEPILTPWGTWLNAAFYYHKNFHKVKSVISKFRPTESQAIRDSQHQFENPQILEDLHTIYNNYHPLVEAITKLQNENDSLPLDASLCIVQNVTAHLHSLTDAAGVRAHQKLLSVLKKNPDLHVLRTIYDKCGNSEPLNDFEQQLLSAKITSIDAERSFSLYKNIFSSRRTSFTEATVETYAMMQMYSYFHNTLPGL